MAFRWQHCLGICFTDRAFPSLMQLQRCCCEASFKIFVFQLLLVGIVLFVSCDTNCMKNATSWNCLCMWSRRRCEYSYIWEGNKSRKSAHHAKIVNTVLKFLLLFEEIKQGIKYLPSCIVVLPFSFSKGSYNNDL